MTFVLIFGSWYCVVGGWFAIILDKLITFFKVTDNTEDVKG
jgi:hypothetical protein